MYPKRRRWLRIRRRHTAVAAVGADASWRPSGGSGGTSGQSRVGAGALLVALALIGGVVLLIAGSSGSGAGGSDIPRTLPDRPARTASSAIGTGDLKGKDAGPGETRLRKGFDDGGDALADADTEGGDAVAGTAPAQLPDQGGHQARPGTPQGMP